MQNREKLFAIIMELKNIKKGEDLEKSAEEAIDQIIKIKYDNEIQEYPNKLLIGIAFRGKEVKLVTNNPHKKLPEQHILKKMKKEQEFKMSKEWGNLVSEKKVSIK